MSKIIEVVVSPQGETKVETKGFAGAECQEASRFIEQALGSKRNETMTGESYQQLSQQHQIQEGA